VETIAKITTGRKKVIRLKIMLRSDEEVNQQGGMIDSSSTTAIPLGNALQEAYISDDMPYMKRLGSPW
jgi:hypothetical protein